MTPTRIPSEHAEPSIGMVHLGLGAFHRAHQAVYLERNQARHDGGAWGLCSANLRSNRRLVELMRERGQRYHVAEYANHEQVMLREIAAIREALYAGPDGEDLETLLTRMSEPGVRIVTLTVTEKGYHLSPADGHLITDAPAIAHDIAEPTAPHSAPGMLVEALARRHAAGIPAFTVLCCDNMPDNGTRTRRAVIDLARHRDERLAEWIADSVAFPCSMVDRIVPAMSEADFERLAALGIDDPTAVVCEAFSQWVVEDDFPQGRPDWEDDGVQMVADVAPFETMKLRMLNGCHSLLAYLGTLAGIETVSDAVTRHAFVGLLRRYMRDEAAPTLATPADTDLEAYADRLIERFANDSLHHRLQQIAMDGSQKLPQRWLSGAQTRLDADGEIGCTALGVAAWIRYTAGNDLANENHPVDDPMAETFAALHAEHHEPATLVTAFLALDAIFPRELADDARFSSAVLHAYRTLTERGITAALTDLDAPTR
ncbi:fructuronate reductase [Chromohalobacter marismortui]|uniref:Fructuronate reductase n=1 Tax=Chromohalobacter marismortui TaxID=42055 RepID=A0A4R7NIB6_9GAMM|nr:MULTISPECIES: mannitol dehydrogenase family protein [Chromohalobacter]MCI0510880.1 mannitol dehydrogenase family protein [Chromohalobacter sp.]MCI0592136.1 mannitol dehydrogenase family protein [Chromohalobacter sp.]TDU20187.1 fructuronate reductase [Chromohalobacter marismortui]